MAVEKASDSQSLYLTQKRRELEEQGNALEIEQAKLARDRGKMLGAERERTDKELVEISKQGERQVELTRKLNADRVHALNDNNNKSYEALAKRTAEDIARMDIEAKRMIEDKRGAGMEKVKFF